MNGCSTIKCLIKIREKFGQLIFQSISESTKTPSRYLKQAVRLIGVVIHQNMMMDGLMIEQVMNIRLEVLTKLVFIKQASVKNTISKQEELMDW
jgi:hypothetical protein